MEPPAKRMRILQSIEVDETNPDYIAAKEKQRAKLQSKFESIFSKFEAMPEAMSDEIDMHTGKIVVDRGHYKKLDREFRRQKGQSKGQLLDNLIADDFDGQSDTEEDPEEDTRDELAPSQSPEPKTRNPGVHHKQPSLEHTSQQAGQVDIAPPLPASTPPTAKTTHITTVSSPNPAANLMQLVQFPQTPAGQHAQSAFMAQITQAVQHAITPIISNLLYNAPSSQPKDVNTMHLLPMPAVNSDNARITAPRSSMSPPHESSDVPAAAQSSPIPAVPPRSKPKRSVVTAVRISPTRPRLTRKVIERVSTNDTHTNIMDFEGPPDNGTPRVENGDKPTAKRILGPMPNYIFTEEDNIYILEQKNTYKRTWQEIRGSRAEWNLWPISAFQNHWYKRLRKRTELRHDKLKDVKTQAARQGSSFEGTQYTQLEQSETQNRQYQYPGGPDSSPFTASHHLPTPSSLEHREARIPKEDTRDSDLEDVEDNPAGGTYFDDDERELLSLAGDGDVAEDPLGDVMMVESPTEADDIHTILPSIETETPEERETSMGVVHTTPTPEIEESKMQPEAAGQVDIAPTSPSVKSSGLEAKRFKFQIDSESEDDLDLVNPSSLATTEPFVCNTCLKSFKTKITLQRHQRNPPAIHIVPVSQSSIREDELLAPTTPIVKHESCTPPRNLLLTTPTLHTPRSAPQSLTLQSSGAKPSSNLARSAFLKRVKQSWATSGRKSSPAPKSVPKRKSFHVAPSKRAWDDLQDSGDELAI